MTRTGTLEGSTEASIFYRVWPAERAPRGVVVIVHGLSEHSARYDHVARFLAERGLTVYANDHIGHGRSGGARGWVARFTDFLDDLEKVHLLASTENPGKPVVLLGHSMGGLIATTYVLERPTKPDFLVLSGPALVPILDPADRRIDPTRLSKDPAVWEEYMSDPLILRERVTGELFDRLADGVALLPGRANEITMPCLLLHGDDDQLCSAEGAKAYVEGSGSRDVTVKIYAGGRHEMFNETNKEEVLADLWRWIDERLG